ncbi:hypothetical protein DUNSADRAFT_14699 [Dunaliella salina]|uniref:Encoded protein n=1 Tax=Dunaliella salina TaxID=3046 RepID=A0ABQ7G6W2_DUNSA|nr:hypothetical protein DUNSADRAFT_14699 [Dunaliella salina]|eukprot:KAF5830348.1 hypothetical protein DUNSADRAFT_14699 [Dunaliella salina]
MTRHIHLNLTLSPTCRVEKCPPISRTKAFVQTFKYRNLRVCVWTPDRVRVSFSQTHWRKLDLIYAKGFYNRNTLFHSHLIISPAAPAY